MSEEGYEATAALLTGTLGFRASSAHGSRFRYECGDGGPGAIVDVLCTPDGRHGSLGAGVVHHVAWRVPEEGSQREWQSLLGKEGLNVSPVMERQYFRSIYFREPGGVLFEIATDPPGFTVDEEPAALGSALRLPPWLEELRPRIEKLLPPLRLPPRDAL
jgi:glyoxalase family protein